jgi:hypothetical protein
MPPRAVWHRIREQAEAEGLINRPRFRRPSTWYVLGGLAAAALMAVVVAPGLRQKPDLEFSTEPPLSAGVTTAPLNILNALMVESREIENDLRSLPSEPRLVRAGTRATILSIEDRIAAIDYQLSESGVQMSPDDREIFWRERVRLMKSLYRLRYAQAQRAAY